MADNLPQLHRRHQALAARLGQVGFAVSGSLTRRYTRCGKPGCRCQADPPQPHGPYYQLTRKVGKLPVRPYPPALHVAGSAWRRQTVA